MFKIGQRVNLWNIVVDMHDRTTRILRSVVVTITDIKIGVPGHHSRIPSDFQSLQGMGDDGKIYEKHWESWPESQTNCFSTQWTSRFDGDPDWTQGEWWIPREAVHVYNDFLEQGKRKGVADRIVGPDGLDIIPSGDVDHCPVHGTYEHRGVDCFHCYMSKRKSA